MKIFNFGSLNIDKVYSVDNFVTGAETISAKNLEIFCGGKGLNQSISVSQSGTECIHCGAVGHNGDILITQLKNYNVNTDYILKKQSDSGHAIIQLDQNGQNAIIVYGGANKELNKDYIDFVLGYTNKDDIVLVQNEINLVDYIIQRACENGNRIAFNPSPITPGITGYPLNLVEFLIINETEGTALSGETMPESICNKLNTLYPNTKVILTLGKQGAVYSFNNQRVFVPAFNVQAIDTTGAGDTFTGYFLSSVLKGYSPQDALKISNAASALSVMKKGASTSIPSLVDVENFLKDQI